MPIQKHLLLLPLLGSATALIAPPSFADHPVTRTNNQLETITVTGTRDDSRLADTAASVGVINQQTVMEINATHSADLLNRIPGVFINQLGSTGQGVSAAIRQPITTGPVYLYLENGVPTRSPAFFNHNALYEVNVAQANGVEVTKGPGSALYGSDAMGGVINVLTNKPITEDRLGLTLEAGPDDWQRIQLNGAKVLGDHHLAMRVDNTESEGWRENNDFTRTSLNLIWQTGIAGFDVNTVYSGTTLDMNTGGTGLNETDYRNNPAKAGNLIGYRDVQSQRLSSAWHKAVGAGDITITPYWRSNRLEYIATWTLNTGRLVPRGGVMVLDSQDAHINDSGDDSYGTQLMYRQDISAWDNAFWIAGLDLDYSKGFTEQTYIERTDDDVGRYWLSYREVRSIYDYDVNFSAVSPYVHMETDIGARWRVNAGLRYDSVRYDYTNHLGTDITNPIHKRPADTEIDLDHLSPKLGVIYKFNDQLNAYAAYRHAFRIPSEGQLFRSGSTVDSTNLEPVTADNVELGLRGQLTPQINFEVTVYEMRKEDEILSVTDETGARRNVNAGDTTHRGVEVGVDWLLTDALGLGVSYAHNKHRFDNWVEGANDFSGNTMPNAPEHFANVRVHYAPTWLNGGRLEAEWTDQGEYFIDEANTLSYAGHGLLNLRASYALNEIVEVYLNVLNAEDKLYAESTSRFGPTYTPGRPRTLMGGVKVNW